IAATTATSVISTWSLARERAGRAREQKAHEQADERLRAANKFIKQLFDTVTPEFSRLAGAAKAQEKLVNASLDFVHELSSGVGGDARLRAAIAKVLVYYSESQSYGEPNTVGDN